VTSLTAGHAPILDFDGTLARLSVQWSELRHRLGVRRIDDLWASGAAARWGEVTDAEVEASRIARPVPAVLRLLREVERFAILSNNSELAVGAFLDRFPELGTRAALVVGRETLGGPKTRFDVFERGYVRCVAAVGHPPKPTYVGDQAYELAFAKQLGADAVDVGSLDGDDA
jgi:phosphoglycolate phosphatase-like HAD superfamily hydrolase